MRLLRLFLLSFLLYTVSAQTICRQGGPKPDECPDTNKWDNINCKWICETLQCVDCRVILCAWPAQCITNTTNNCGKCVTPTTSTPDAGLPTWTPKTCTSNEGFPIAIDSSYKEKCNSCTCRENGQSSCTRKFCPDKCYDDDGNGYKADDTRKAKDGCNTCTCGDDGRWRCTEMACQGTTIPSTPVPGRCATNEGGYVSAGESYREQCNYCTCSANGMGMCTKMGCFGTCWDNNGKAYQDGDTRTAADGGCCICGGNGKWSCTKMACPKTTPTPVPGRCATNEGGYVSVGQGYKDKCNSCTCQANGMSICTEMFCIGTCWDNNGKAYQDGDTRTAADGGCCTCGGNGKWTCTKTACLKRTCGERGVGCSVVDCGNNRICVEDPVTCDATCQDDPIRCTQQCKDMTCPGYDTPQMVCDIKVINNTCTWVCPPPPTTTPTGRCATNEGGYVSAGESYRDKCNSCTCQANGMGMCTRMGCIGTCWDNNGKAYEDGDTRTAADGGCCTCGRNGKWTCTKTTCPKPTTRPPIRGCVSNEGKPIAIGQGYFDECNSCTCEANGFPICTLKFCIGTCWDDNGKAYKAGETRKTTDGGCCTCGENGQWGCTQKACSSTGAVVLTVTFNIQWSGTQTASAIASAMRIVAREAGVINNFLINNADIKKIKGYDQKWTVKVAFKDTATTDRRTAYEKFMTILSQAAHNASGATISGTGMGGGVFSRGGAIGGANPLLIVSEDDQVDSAIETMAMQSCENGEEISAEQQCPTEEMIVPLAQTSSSSSSTRSLVPIIGAAVGGAVMLTLIIVTIIAIRRHRANSVKAMNYVQREGPMTPNPAITVV